MFLKKKAHNYLQTQQAYSGRDKPTLMLMGFFVLLIACFFYSTGNFGFWNVFGLRREAQLLLIICLLPLILIIFSKFQILLKKPLLCLIFALLFTDIMFQRNMNVSHIMDRTMAILCVGFILSTNRKYGNNILKCIIIICSVFSMMQIIQSFFVFMEPELIPVLHSEYTSSSGGDKVEISHPLAYLGFTSYRGAYYLFGHEITRFRSFASEPSVLVYSFFVPGILALSYKGYIRLCAFPILFFSILLVQSGTIWVSALLGIIFFGLFAFFGRRVMMFSILPFLIAVFWFTILPKIDIYLFVVGLQNVVGIGDGTYSGLNRAGSIIHRLGPFIDAIPLAKKHFLFGVPVDQNFGGGFLLWILINSGLIGLIFAIIFFSQIFKLCIQCFNKHKGTTQLMAAIMYGTILQVLMFVCNGWNRSVGFLMLALIICRLEYLVYEGDKKHSMVNNKTFL